MKKSLQYLFWHIAICIALAAPTAKGADNSLLTSNSPDRLAKLEAAAKAEGGFTLYTSLAKSDVDALSKPFEDKYGIKVTVWRAGSDQILQRTVQEQKAGRRSVDAIHTSSPELEALSREGMLQPLNSPRFAELRPGSMPASKTWVGTFLAVWVQAYNTDRIKAGDLPKSYEDLLDRRWKNKLGYEASDIDWFITVLQIMGEERGLNFFRKLVGTNGLSIRKGHSLLNNLVAAGEVPLGLTVYNYMPAQAKAKGAPIDWTVIEPAVARASGVAVVKNAEHPNAAALFAEYMLSDGQKILTTLDYVPTSTKVTSPMKDVEIRVADPAVTLDGFNKWDPLYKKLVLDGKAD
ncbi:ABC transporter substrate-binding protein [Ancylobacter polymorphus]|jgi:iron(III) transport system substrate-binding protein|uniref:Iron(III) transport system substrate-binding protein n=1 Tax=Ancylobacter polymorphus TaxID=223390 RepID=A0ABU0BI25_9HYPH|nr:extracellular solute-binding protein [Ancylobacter polymorphus]MDQ0304961.1 iron(III) transport system substrate-binding protein [Ancylobacter polymorphus]